MIRRLVNPLLDRQTWADDVGEFLQKLYLALLRPIPPLKDLLHGTWLGHALHPVITDVPIGAFTAVLVLDLIAILGGNLLVLEGAKWIALVGFVAMIGAAVTGIADYTGLYGKELRYGTLHSLLMFFSGAFYLFTVLVRFGLTPGTETHAFTTGLLGYLFLVAGAYIGGEQTFGLGVMVDRHAWRTGGDRWAALEPSAFPEGTPTKARAGGQSLVVVRRGDTLHALHDTCAHAGCSLAEMGQLVRGGEQIECGCHGSRYRLKDGTVARGPATYDQPVFDVRRSEGRIEARRRGAAAPQ